MATLPPITYALDPTGENPDNLVSGEVHVMAARQKRAVAPDYGAYYTDSLVVVEQSSGDELVRGTHYECIEMLSVPTARFGQQVCGLLLITDPNVDDTIEITYQTVGGEYSKSLQALKQLIDALELDTREAHWPSLIGKPEEFPPAAHLHDIGDVYGFEYLVHALERIRRAIELGDTVTHDAVFRYIDNVIEGHPSTAEVSALIATALSNHTAASNPHPQYAQQIYEVRQPIIVGPDANEVLASLTPQINISEFRSLYGQSHAATEIQIATNSAFSAGLWTSPTLGPVSSYPVPSGTLNGNVNYWVRARYQDEYGSWSPYSDGVKFTTGTAAVATPSVTAPTNGQVGLALTPTLTGSAFAMSQGSDTHGYSEWEITTAANGGGTLVWNSQPDPINRTTIVVPTGVLDPSTVYHYRVRHYGSLGSVSAWSSSKQFTTASSAPSVPALGNFFGGGYIAGYFRIGAQKYALIVSPQGYRWRLRDYLTYGGLGGRLGYGDRNDLRLAMRSDWTTSEVAATSLIDGRANTLAMHSKNTSSNTRFPAARWAVNQVINGFNDWYIPARDELEIIYRYLKATTDSNKTGSRQLGGSMGENAYSDPIGAAYSSGTPAKTAVALFQQGGEQSLDDTREHYWSSSLVSTSQWRRGAWAQRMRSSGSGEQVIHEATQDHPVRLVRRVPVPG